MKKTIVIFVVCGFCFVTPEAANIKETFDNLITKNTVHNELYSSLLDMLKELIKQGYPDAGIPALDPYQQDYVNIDFKNKIFRIFANITDVTFNGLSDFEMRKCIFTVEEEAMYAIDFDVYFPSLKFTSEYYKMEGSIVEIFPLAGEGLAHAEVVGLNIWSKFYLKFNGDGSGAFIDRLEEPGFHVLRILSKIEYDNNIDDIANAMVEDLLADYLNRFSNYLVVTYSPLLVEALNTALAEN